MGINSNNAEDYGTGQAGAKDKLIVTNEQVK
jgi:hypothetical protein